MIPRIKNSKSTLSPPMRILFSSLMIALVCFLQAVQGHTLDLFAPDKPLTGWKHAVQVQAFPEKNKVAAGESFQFHVILTLAEGWHIYSLKDPGDDGLPTEVTLTESLFDSKEPWQESSPRMFNDKVLERMVKVHFHRAEFSSLRSVPSHLSPGRYPIKGAVRFRACDNKVCTMPRELRFNSDIQVVSTPRG